MNRTEVSIAVNFVLSFLYNRLPRRRVHLLGEQLGRSLAEKFQGHWYPEQPLKGTAFRCLKLSGEQSDPILLAAAKETGLDVAEVMQHLPQNLTLWIDPGEVSCRVGEKGHVTQLYSSAIEIEQQEQHLQQHQHQQQTGQQASCMYTAAEFSQTKFGSTKLRQQATTVAGSRQQHQQQQPRWQRQYQRQHQHQHQQHQHQLGSAAGGTAMMLDAASAAAGYDSDNNNNNIVWDYSNWAGSYYYQQHDGYGGVIGMSSSGSRLLSIAISAGSNGSSEQSSPH